MKGLKFITCRPAGIKGIRLGKGKSSCSALKAFLMVALVVLLFSLDGNICIYKKLFGIPCPGCGMTRAYLKLFECDIAAALYYHPLFIFPPVIVLIILLKHNKRFGWLYTSNIFWALMLAVILITWAVRMLVLFPHKEPMDFNKNAVIPELINLISELLKRQ